MLSRRAMLKVTVGLCGCGACAATALSAVATAVEPERISGTGYDIGFGGTQLDTIANGKIAGLIDLRTLANPPHLYAIGPIEKLRGEVTVVDRRLSRPARRVPANRGCDLCKERAVAR